MGAFVYHRPETVDDALALLAEHGFDAKVLAGGQSLIPMMSAGLADPAVVVDINAVPGLGAVEVTGSGGEGERQRAGGRGSLVRIGALARHRDLEHAGPAVGRAAPLLPAAAGFIAHAAIRNRGTFVGSLVHADPSAEWPAVALALDAEIRLRSVRGERVVAVSDFLLGPMTTAIEPDELAVEVSLVAAGSPSGVSVQELAYRDGDYAVVGVAAQVTGSGERVDDCRIVAFGVDATPVRASAAEALLRDAGRAGLDAAARLARQAAQPMSDATASADYRSEMISVLCRRALHEAFHRNSTM
jgi:carbon-monoxide dehydrogenase medium subunit